MTATLKAPSTERQAQENPSARAYLFAIAGFLLGMLDYTFFWIFGIEIRAADWNVTLLVTLLFASNFAMLGFLVGHLFYARATLLTKNVIIDAQLRELESKQQRLLETERMAALGQLAAGVAHEVRNPLGVIRSAAALMVEDLEPGSDSARAGHFICEEVDRLDAFIRALLGFSRPLNLQLKPVSVVEIGRMVAQRIDTVLQQHAAVFSCPQPSGPELQADPDVLVGSLIGVVQNAVQALNGPGAIELRSGSDGAMVYLEVADSGPGVPPEIESRILEPFFTTKVDGTGLGLAMAARVAQEHGGRLEVRQGLGLGEKGAGACFRFWLRPAFVASGGSL